MRCRSPTLTPPAPTHHTHPARDKDLLNDHAKRVTADDLKEVFMARAINLEQIMRVSGKQLEGEAGAGSIAR